MPCQHRDSLKRGTSENITSAKDKLGSQALLKLGVVEPNGGKYKLLHPARKSSSKFLSSRANCGICCSCFHSVYFVTLCIHLTCCGTLGASEESSAHTTGSFKIAALVFRFAERRHAVASPRLVRKRCK